MTEASKPMLRSGTESGDALTRLNALAPRGKYPNSTRILDGWVAKAQAQVRVDHGRLGWLVASTVVIAALQRAIDDTMKPRFLLKGGTYLQHRFNWTGRATTDIDGIVRGDLAEFITALDDGLQQPWGPLTLTRTEVEIINAPAKLIKPRRFEILASLKGQTWRRVKVEISGDEAGITGRPYSLPAPSLEHFGLPTPDLLVGIALEFQIAQKLHASTDPHNPPEQVNDRVRDIVDLLMLRQLPEVSLAELRSACIALFQARAEEASALGMEARTWPPTAIAFPRWRSDYERAARDAGIDRDFQASVDSANEWICEIDSATQDTG
jgi:hypothetical protein